MSDIIFIKNEQDYFEYKKLKPIRVFSRKKVKFICSQCKQVKEVLTYIKSIYNDIIIENTKHIIPNKELDIYLPNLKLAFEYDGTYWHADPRFYKENDLIWHKKVTANEIWKRDMEKDILCNQYKIKLIRVKEYDWITNNIDEKSRILKIINEAIHEQI